MKKTNGYGFYFKQVNYTFDIKEFLFMKVYGHMYKVGVSLSFKHLILKHLKMKLSPGVNFSIIGS